MTIKQRTSINTQHFQSEVIPTYENNLTLQTYQKSEHGISQFKTVKDYAEYCARSVECHYKNNLNIPTPHIIFTGNMTIDDVDELCLPLMFSQEVLDYRKRLRNIDRI